MRLAGLAVLCAVCAHAYAQGGDADRHLLAGVRAFKDGRYDEALVELRVVEHAPDAPDDLAFYLGPTLVKLGRDREALDVFLRSPAPADALTGFYLGEAYYHLRLYRKARVVFSDLRAHGLGPVLDEAAGRYIRAVDDVYAQPVLSTTVDYYASQAREQQADPFVAAELWDEARQVDGFVAGQPGLGALVEALAAAWNDSNRASRVVDLLATKSDRTPEQLWQLARAYAAIADHAHARSLLELIVRAKSAHANDAKRLLASMHAP